MRKLRWTRPGALVPALLLLLVVFGIGCWVKNIDTPYYTQTTSYYCGAASAQMILNSENLGIWVSSQSTLYNYIHSHNACSGWYSDPKGLRDVLNLYGNSHTPPAYFAYYTPSSQDDGNKKLSYTIDRYGVPPTVLIYGCAHWVVVRGTITSDQPTAVSSYTISGFFVNDPWYGSSSLGENKYIDISSWNADYFTGCSWCGAPGGNKFISVVDPNPVPELAVEYPRVRPRRDEIIPPQEILRFARETVEVLEGQREFHERFARGLEMMRSSKMVEPLLVHRSDRERSAYYIVPFNLGPNTAGAMLLDAYSGQLLELSSVPEPIRYLPSFEPDFARELFLRKLPSLELRPEVLEDLQRATEGKLRVRPEFREELELRLREDVRLRLPERERLRLREEVAPEVRPPSEIRPPAELRRLPELRIAQPKTPTFDRLQIRPTDVRVTDMRLVWEPSGESQNPYYPLWAMVGEVKGLERAHLLGYVTPQGDVLARLTPVAELEVSGGGGRPAR